MFRYGECETDYGHRFAVGLRVGNRRNGVDMKNRPHRRTLDRGLAKFRLKEWLKARGRYRVLKRAV